jgi:tRNA A-37 threonylcarbamoyl transferase component Bud32
MDLRFHAHTLADPDYYAPLHRFTDRSTRFRPNPPLAGWHESYQDTWVMWKPPRSAPLPDQGWKIHISATLPRAQAVLDVVAAVCDTDRMPFKHLRSELEFLFATHKHAERTQAGKFCTVYPPDEGNARRVLVELAERLAHEDGPHILSDRRFGDSRTVHYRYGAFRPMVRLHPDGGMEHLVHDGTGALVPDVRTFRFVLPAGIQDPFAGAPADPAPPPADGVRIGRYRLLAALRQSNAGGTYRGVDPDGRTVFVKEARAHNGLYWDGSTARQRLRREHEVLRDLHRLAPGVAPEPLDHFRRWEHDFLVTEFVPGRPLLGWAAHHNPYLLGGDGRHFRDYFDRCRHHLAALVAALDHLHDAGYRFGDVSPYNILVTDEGGLRLVDFEACGRLDHPPVLMGVPGYVPAHVDDWAGTGADDYGLSTVALSLILPLHTYLARNPAGAAHLYADAARRCPVPDDLWRLATSHLQLVAARRAGGPARDRDDGWRLPEPEEVATDPLPHLHRLRDAIGRELAATAALDDPDRIWPTTPRGYDTNTLCVAHGAAGVLHALHQAELPVAAGVVARLRRDTHAGLERLPPGLHYGTAGIAWVLAEQGHLDHSVELIDAAVQHPLTATTGTWGGGSAGVGTALLAVYASSGVKRLAARAVQLGDALCAGGDLTALVGPDNACGLLHGRAGIALFLHQLWRLTGESHYLRRGVALLHAELDRAVEMRGGELGFHDSDAAPRVMPYLETGSAGIGLVLARYVRDTADERLALAAGHVFAYADRTLTVQPGLYLGLAGLALAHAEHADLAASDIAAGLRERALRAAVGLFKYVSPGPGGRARVLGLGALRFSCDLASGAAGVLLALDRVLHGSRAQFFTLDKKAEGGDHHDRRALVAGAAERVRERRRAGLQSHRQFT